MNAYKIKVEIGVALVVCLIGVFFLFQAMTITQSQETIGPRTMPLFLAIMLILGGIYLGVRAYLGKVGEVNREYGFLESNIKRIFAVVGCGVFFLAIFLGFGYFLSLIHI